MSPTSQNFYTLFDNKILDLYSINLMLATIFGSVFKEIFLKLNFESKILNKLLYRVMIRFFNHNKFS